MDGELIRLFDSLYRRVGELTSHLGRYDMQLLALTWTLTEEIVLRELIEKWRIDSRVDIITRLMRARSLPAHFQISLLAIHRQMKPVLDRQTLSPSHPAVITQPGFARPWDSPTRPPLQHAWFNRTETISKEEVGRAIASVEHDILTSVKQYLSLATLASRVQSALVEPGLTPPTSMMA